LSAFFGLRLQNGAQPMATFVDYHCVCTLCPKKTTQLWLAITSTNIEHFGRNVTDKVSIQMVLDVPTSPN